MDFPFENSNRDGTKGVILLYFSHEHNAGLDRMTLLDFCCMVDGGVTIDTVTRYYSVSTMNSTVLETTSVTLPTLFKNLS
jgi:hypothetical protein